MKESKSSKSHMTRRFFATVAVAVLATLFSGVLYAQVAVKTNLLYDATTSPNLGVEVGVAPKSTVQLVYGLNPLGVLLGSPRRQAGQALGADA